MITIYTLTYNEQYMLPHFIAHYRRNFPACKIVVYDNYSTDNTVQIATDAGCQVMSYNSGGRLNDATYLQIKNNCFKSVRAGQLIADWQLTSFPAEGWALIADCDELCNITSTDLRREERFGTSVITFEGYNMVNLKDTMPTFLSQIETGVRAPSYDKFYCFNTRYINEINYHMGCHTAAPRGTILPSKKVYAAFHYKYLNPDYMIARHAHFATRLSPENLAKGYGGHYLYTPEQIRAEFEDARKKAIKIL